jgi:hypothetical protein
MVLKLPGIRLIGRSLAFWRGTGSNPSGPTNHVDLPTRQVPAMPIQQFGTLRAVNDSRATANDAMARFRIERVILTV